MQNVNNSPNQEASNDTTQIAYSLGMQLLSRIAEKSDVSIEEAAAMAAGKLENGFSSKGQEIALELSRLNNEGKLSSAPETYIANPEFARLAMELGCEQAVAIIDQKSVPSGTRLTERAMINRSLPQSSRSEAAISSNRDYSAMSSAQFNKLKQQYRNAAANGLSHRL